MLNIISLGAGVQSSTMALMAAHGEITPMPDHAIFADTQAEPAAIYKWLDWLEKQLPFPVHRVTAGNLLQNALSNKTLSGHDWQDVPWRTKAGGLGRRQCTTNYKIKPIGKKVRELSGGAPVIQWIGISADEAHRMKPSRVAYITHRWPLLEIRFTRLHCLRWMLEKGYERPTKSSCIFCPYKGNAEWRELEPPDFDMACDVDDGIRHLVTTPGTVQYAHRDLVPLREADIRSAEEAGQQQMFGEECEGMCGV